MAFKKTTIIFCLVLLVSTIIKFASVWGNNFAFTIDQGRDMVDVRRMIVNHSPRLIGPTTSINGVYLGPFYYYFISIPFLLSSGSPAAVVFWQIIWFQLAVIVLWLVLSKKSTLLANVVGILLLLSPVGFYTARYFWNANLMPVFTILFFASLLYTLWHKNNRSILILGLIAGFSMQIEAAFGILFFPFAFLVFLFKKYSLRDLLLLFSSFFATLIPQILFEFRHDFLMTKTLVAGLSGSSDILGKKLNFWSRVDQRKEVFTAILRDTNHISYEILGLVLLGALIVGICYIFNRQKSALKEVLVLTLSFCLLSGLFYLVFSQQVKGWYVLGLAIPVIIFLSAVMTNLYQMGNLGVLILGSFMMFTFYHVYLAQSEYVTNFAFKPSDDPSNLTNQMKAIDWVYQESDNKAFYVYNYLPSIYDYPYQYLFWWYGTRKYGYQPTDVAYLPNKPEYITDHASFWTKKKSADANSPTFLIVENDPEHMDRLYAWGGSFTHLCKINSIQITDALSVTKLAACSKR